MHLCTENIRSRIRSPRSLPSKIHAAAPPQNFAAVESLLRAKRAARSSFSWPHALLSERNRQEGPARGLSGCGISNRNEMARSFVYGVPRSTAPIGSRVVLNYDLTPAEWASGSVTMRFLVENYPKKVIPTFWRGRPCLAVTSVT